jgi:hypothetical protein
VPGASSHGRKKAIWRRFGTWLLLGLEFELAADIVRSVIAPDWMDIGQLGAIAVIRTFLNYFLEKDLEHAEAEGDLSTGTPTLAATTALMVACLLGARPADAQSMREVHPMPSVDAGTAPSGATAAVENDVRSR